MIIPIKTNPRNTLSDVEKKLFFFFFFLFLASVEFFLGCLLTACFDSDDLAVAFFSELTDGTGVTLGKVLVSVMSSKTTLASRLWLGYKLVTKSRLISKVLL